MQTIQTSERWVREGFEKRENRMVTARFVAEERKGWAEVQGTTRMVDEGSRVGN